MSEFVTFGEIMLRLRAPGYERFFQSPQLEATFGGGEANVAVSLSNYGFDAAFVTALPDNDIGQNAINTLRGLGVKTDMIKRQGDRVGIYFLETGANQPGPIHPSANVSLGISIGLKYSKERNGFTLRVLHRR